MKDEKIENLENKPNRPAAEKAKKSAKNPPKVKKEKKQTDNAQLPVLVEFAYTVSIVLVIILALTILMISILSGANLLTAVLRTSVAIFAIGGVLIFISSQISSGLLFSSRIEQEEYEKKQAEEGEDLAGMEEPLKAEV